MNRQSIHVVQVNAVDARGGAALVARSLHRAYRKRGVVASMAVGTKLSDEDGVVELPNHASKPRVRRALLAAADRLAAMNDRVPGTWRLGEAVRWLAEPRRRLDIRRGVEDFHEPGARRLLDMLDPPADVLHCHNLHGGFFDLTALPSLSQRLPTILTLHDAWLLSGHCAHSFDCDRWKTGCGACPDLSIYPAVARDATAGNWRRKQHIFSRSRLRVATPCHWLMRKVRQSMLAPSIIEARVIPNGVDRNVYHPGDRGAARAALGLRDDANVLLFAADGIRRSPWKDYQTLRAAVAEVGRRMPGRRLLFIALGERGGHDRIGDAELRFVAFQSDPHAVARYYQAADVYLHAARADTFPNVVLEAMACGTPVVATDVGGISEQVADGITGMLVPPADAQALAQRTVTLLTHPALRQAMSAHAVARVAERFDLEQQVEAYLTWYQELTGRASLKAAA